LRDHVGLLGASVRLRTVVSRTRRASPWGGARRDRKPFCWSRPASPVKIQIVQYLVHGRAASVAAVLLSLVGLAAPARADVPSLTDFVLTPSHAEPAPELLVSLAPAPRERVLDELVASGRHWRLETERGPVHVWTPASYDPET